jgi:acyl-CoA thioester hydrolase
VLPGAISPAAGFVHLREDCQITTSDVEDPKAVGCTRLVIITRSFNMNDSSQKKLITRGRAQTTNTVTPYHITSLRVPFFEVDMGQAVYHGNYYHFFELGREDFLRITGFPYREFLNRQLHLTIIESRCKYRKALRYDDEIEIHSGITSLSRRNLSFSQLIYRPAEALANRKTKSSELELCTQTQLNMICLRFTGQTTHLPEGFLLAVEAMRKRRPAEAHRES